MASPLIDHILTQVTARGFQVLNQKADPRLEEQEFEAVRSQVDRAEVISISTADQTGELAIWQMPSMEDSLALSTAFNAYEQRMGCDRYRFYLLGGDYILLDQVEGWQDEQEMADFLAEIVP